MLQPCTVISRRQFTLTTKSLGVPETLLIDLTMKSHSGFESANPRLVIGKHLINSSLFHSNKAMFKLFKI